MAARRFLWIIVIIFGLVLAAAFAYRLFGTQVLQLALVPSMPFEESPRPATPDYSNPENWVSRPGKANDPSLWTPEGYNHTANPGAVVFYIPPTTYLKRDRWNAPLEDTDSRELLDIFARSQASVFNGVAEVWAPRYRQATFGAFLTSRNDAEQALDFAYQDVRRAFHVFLDAQPPGRPIILAGHSQGSLHLTRLLAEEIAGTATSRRIVAAYVVGWPVSMTADLPALGLPGCTTPSETGCVLSWESFSTPADPSGILDVFEPTRGFTGRPRAGTNLLCINPLLGTQSTDAAPPGANHGSLTPNSDLTGATLEAGKVGAQCDPKGILLIGDPPQGFGRFILPGSNYHVYDYALFWADTRADVERRLKAYEGRAATGPTAGAASGATAGTPAPAR